MLLAMLKLRHITFQAVPTPADRVGRTVVLIKLSEFDSKGKDKNGDRCDVVGNKRCDPKFKFCVDKYTG